MLRSLKDPIMSTIDGVSLSAVLSFKCSYIEYMTLCEMSIALLTNNYSMIFNSALKRSVNIILLSTQWLAFKYLIFLKHDCQVEYIPSAKIASLFVVFGLVIICKLYSFFMICLNSTCLMFCTVLQKSLALHLNLDYFMSIFKLI